MMPTRNPAELSSFPRKVARLVAFDLRRFRVPVAVVVGLELFRAASAEWVLHRGPLLSRTAFGDTSAAFEFQALDGALWLATAITTVILVQADHPADDRGFLRSRPIGPWPLAIAKLTVFAALFGVVPFVATSARLIAYGAPAASIGASAVQFLVIGGAVVLPAWTLALVTRTLPRCLSAAAGLAILWYVAIAAVVSAGPGSAFGYELLNRITNRGILATFAPPLTDWQRVDALGWLFGVVMTLLAAAVLVSYYRNRRPIASALGGLALVAVALFVPARTVPGPASPALVAMIDGRLRLPALVVSSQLAVQTFIANSDNAMLVMGDVGLPPIPVNVSSERALGRVHVTGPGIDLWADGMPLYGHDATGASAAAAQATEPAWTSEPGAEMLFSVPPQRVEALRDRHVDVEAPVDLQFTRHVLVGDVPLRAGVAFRTDAYLVEVLSVDLRERSVYCRFTRFPSLARRTPNVVAFIGHPRTRIVRAMPGQRPAFDGDFSTDDLIGWAVGRTWTRQVRLPLTDLAAAQTAPRLRIVESRPAGGMRTTLVARDVPVLTRQPRPQPPALLDIGPGGGARRY